MEVLLKQWGLECLINNFNEQGVSIDMLEDLVEEDFAVLAPCIRERNPLRKNIRELVKAVNDTPPGQPVLFLSGDTGNAEIDEGNRETLTDTGNGEIDKGNRETLTEEEEERTDQLLNKDPKDKQAESTQGDNNDEDSELVKTISKGPISKGPISHTSVASTSQQGFRNQASFALTLSSPLFDLNEVLNDSPEGLLVLAQHNNHQRLLKPHRRHLVRAIVNFYTKKKIRLSKEHCELVADQIEELFPTESATTYYKAPYTEGENQKRAKGKLFDKRNNTYRYLIDGGAIPRLRAPKRKKVDSGIPNSKQPCKSVQLPSNSSTSLSISNDSSENPLTTKNSDSPGSSGIESEHLSLNGNSADSAVITEETEKENKNLLSQNFGTWQEKEDLWRKSSNIRKHDFESEKDIIQVLSEWPVLTDPQSYKLINIDFMLRYPETDKIIFKKWSVFQNKVLAVCEEWKPKCEPLIEILKGEYPPGAKVAATLNILSYLCPPVNRIKISGNAKKVRYRNVTVEESKLGILNFIDESGHLQEKLNARTAKLKADGLSPQPILIFQGDPKKAPQAVYVCLMDKICYTFSNILEALDICFKMHFVLNVFYTKYSCQVWTLLQLVIYGITTPKDKISNVLGEFLPLVGYTNLSKS